MSKSLITIHLKNINDTRQFANIFSQAIEKGMLICLFGPIGSGKTTFIQFVCNELNVTENVTSPSFVILNEYYSGKMPVYHFDLYRLEKEGISTIVSELEEYSSNTKALTFIEWADFYPDDFVDERIELNFTYDESYSDSRNISIKAFGKNSQEFLERLNQYIVTDKF